MNGSAFLRKKELQDVVDDALGNDTSHHLFPSMRALCGAAGVARKTLQRYLCEGCEPPNNSTYRETLRALRKAVKDRAKELEPLIKNHLGAIGAGAAAGAIVLVHPIMHAAELCHCCLDRLFKYLI